MDKKIESYIDKIVSQLNCDEEEKREIIDEMRDHLYLLKNEYLDQGFTMEEAIQKSLVSFGEQKQLTKGLQESLFPFYKAFKIGVWILFGLYSFITLFKLLFQRIIFRITDYTINGDTLNRYAFTPMNSEGFFEFIMFNSNIIPFKNTIEYLTGFERFNTDIIINNTLGNILIFLPLGIFLPLLFKKYRRFTKVFVTSIVISFSVEILQLVLKIGQFDIDDVILNTTGSIVGFFLLKIIKSVLTIPKGSFFRRITN
ncbi:VanZ family protein [Ornithinibacillus sp. L9]|uniref:VanZ family protein n=1 Tax=Ornithinibacillus caprae TaxID=2678566 RepID=A0A6N8FMF0_9BACI|nr:VanZ family protein [Ornithinibacillus caprae]MUK88508.1 VanZ family protein [Ornithinibacillus caprae]